MRKCFLRDVWLLSVRLLLWNRTTKTTGDYYCLSIFQIFYPMKLEISGVVVIYIVHLLIAIHHLNERCAHSLRRFLLPWLKMRRHFLEMIPR